MGQKLSAENSYGIIFYMRLPCWALAEEKRARTNNNPILKTKIRLPNSICECKSENGARNRGASTLVQTI